MRQKMIAITENNAKFIPIELPTIDEEEIQAAIGQVQLRKLPAFLKSRAEYAQLLTEELGKLPGITSPYAAPEARHSFYGYTIKVNQEEAGISRDDLHDRLAEDSSETRIRYPASNHHQPNFQNLSGQIRTMYPCTLSEAKRPINYNVTELPVTEASTKVMHSLLIYPRLAREGLDHTASSFQRDIRH